MTAPGQPAGDWMKKLANSIVVYLPAELDAWLNEKARNGYKKASLVRHIIELYIAQEGGRNGK